MIVGITAFYFQDEIRELAKRNNPPTPTFTTALLKTVL